MDWLQRTGVSFHTHTVVKQEMIARVRSVSEMLRQKKSLELRDSTRPHPRVKGAVILMINEMGISFSGYGSVLNAYWDDPIEDDEDEDEDEDEDDEEEQVQGNLTLEQKKERHLGEKLFSLLLACLCFVHFSCTLSISIAHIALFCRSALQERQDLPHQALQVLRSHQSNRWANILQALAAATCLVLARLLAGDMARCARS